MQKVSQLPLKKKLKLEPATNEKEITEKPYIELVGCLIYLLNSRPDICFALNYFARFQDKATNEHWTHLKRILRYLKETKDQVLIYKRHEECDTIHGYADADWGADPVDQKSVSGQCFMIFGNMVSWSIKKQNTVSLSSTEAEYKSLSTAVCETPWLRMLLNEMEFNVDKPTIIHEVNQPAIHLAKNRENSKRTKHLDIRYHFIKDEIQNGSVDLKYICTRDKIADIFTKGLGGQSFSYLRDKLGLLRLSK